ncbi:hypothetical protein C8R44DRAFT_938023 [Mycena epipterygia]|nr:hypothetical protein C8R44DRAFT_938023 [Mycena epipterygia]
MCLQKQNKYSENLPPGFSHTKISCVCSDSQAFLNFWSAEKVPGKSLTYKKGKRTHGDILYGGTRITHLQAVLAFRGSEGRGCVALVRGLADASIKGQWKFMSGKTGTLLVMLLEVPALKDKYLVTAVACDAYSIGRHCIVGAVGDVPGDTRGPAYLGGRRGREQLVERDGRGRAALRRGRIFAPLFTLKCIQKKTFFPTRGMSPASEDEEMRLTDCRWEDPEPWGPLDEEGVEEEEAVGCILKLTRGFN